MKLTEHIKDRAFAYIIYTLTAGLALIFLSAYRVQTQAIAVIGGILLIGGICGDLWGFFRKKAYYDKLLNCLDELDRKYLLSEMVSEPDFLDGRIIHRVMRETNKSMCEKIAEYRRANEEFREYIELWVHEVKLPVASLQLMCHNDGSTRYSEQLKRIDDYIENVLYYARSGSAEKDYVIKPVEIRRVFTDTAIKNRTELQERDISLSAEGLNVTVMTDAKWLGFILGQLMANSIKYDAGEIAVTAEDSPEKTVLRFRDNGAGIPESDLPYIFEKSFTGENGRTHSKSTGMGLYIVKKLCDRLGHTVSASSVRGEYTEIAITFGKNDMFFGTK